MHANTFDHYIKQESLIHRLDPRVKVVATVLFIISNVLLPDGAWLAFLFTWGLILWMCVLARVSWGFVFKRSLLALPFAMAAVTIIFTLPGETVFTLAIGPWQFTATDAGLVRFSSILIRSWLSIQAAILLTAATSLPDLMHALRHLNVPQMLVAIISFTYRYLFVLTDEAMRLLRAREARSARLVKGGGGGSLLWRAQVAGNMAGQLFLRSYERSDRVYNAMLARGYNGHFYTLNPHIIQRRDWTFALLTIVALLAVQVVGRR